MYSFREQPRKLKESPYPNHNHNHSIIKPARSAGFSPIKKIPYQAPPTQLGPRKCTFWKNALLGPKY